MDDKPQHDTVETMGGYRETYGISQDLVPLFADTGAQFASYERRRGNLDQYLESVRTGHTTDPRAEAWNNLIETLKPVQNKALVAEIVNSWVNTLVKYDDAKFLRRDSADPNWFQTPQETFFSGKGTCADIALLKRETLLRLGIKDSDMRMVGGTSTYHDGTSYEHMVLEVNLGNHNMVLNSQQVDFGKNPVSDFTTTAELKHISHTHGDIYSDNGFVRGSNDAEGTAFSSFIPEISYNNANGVKGYDPPPPNYAYKPYTRDLTPQELAAFNKDVAQLGEPIIENLIRGAASLNPEYIHFSPANPLPRVKQEPLPPLHPKIAHKADHPKLRKPEENPAEKPPTDKPLGAQPKQQKLRPDIHTGPRPDGFH